MGLWGVLIDILKTAASHAAPHVAKSAVDMARERMAANDAARRDGANAEELSQALAALDQRIIAAEQRAAAAEEQLTAVQEFFARKWASARVWVIALLAWNAMLTGLLIYLVVTRR
ncbi:MAG TPA: hypothetical protein VF532_18430 [Candidatus Angelobacter sp.]